MEQVLLVLLGAVAAMVGGVAAGWANYRYGILAQRERWEHERATERERWDREQRQAALERRVEEARGRLAACSRLSVRTHLYIRELNISAEAPSQEVIREFSESLHGEVPLLPFTEQRRVLGAFAGLVQSEFAENLQPVLINAVLKTLRVAQQEWQTAMTERDAALGHSDTLTSNTA